MRLIFIIGAILLSSRALSQLPCGSYIITGNPVSGGVSTPLAPGSLDLNWELIDAPSGITTPQFLSVRSLMTSSWSYWNIDTEMFSLPLSFTDFRALRPTAINEDGEVGFAMAPGLYKYRTKFNLEEDLSGIVFNLQYLADNRGKVYLNGELIGEHSAAEFYNLGIVNEVSESIVDESLFVAGGENILEIHVTNYNWNYINPDGVLEVRGTPTGLLFFGEIGFVRSVISGYTFNDINANGSLDIGEMPLEGLEIQLFDEGGDMIESTFSSETGFYTFSNLPAGEYKVTEIITEGYNTFPGTSEYTELILDGCNSITELNFLNTKSNRVENCSDCGSSFKPIPNNRYWLSAWVSVDYLQQQKTFSSDLEGPFIRTIFLGTDAVIPEFFPTGEIIDGWQRIVGSFYVPDGAANISVSLNAHPEFDTYFDDIRIHPFNGSMKSYVYDGETFWLSSELDDNNYATFYEYDEEGGLIRIKKETSRGIVTIQETRSNTVKEEVIEE